MVRSNVRDRNILFLCHDNACLSLIAEALAKEHLPPKTQVFSAGLNPAAVDPNAIQVLREIGIDVSAREAKRIDAVPIHDMDLIIALGLPHNSHPTGSSRVRLRHWDVGDPRREPGADLQTFRHVRDEIDDRVAALFLDHWRNTA
jgi:arsenate reductase